MKYLVLETGFGEGCDYTIGCNMRWDVVELDACTIEEAHAYFTRCALYGGDGLATPLDYCKIEDMEGQIKTLIILPYVDAEEIDMDEARTAHNIIHDMVAHTEAENEERAEYKRLKDKFE